MAFLNIMASLMAAVSLSFVVLHPSIKEGLWIKGGFILMILSLLGSAAIYWSDAPLTTAFNAGFGLRIGIVIACLGYGIKYRRARREGGPTDFGSLTER